LKLFSFSAWNTLLHALVAFKVSIEKSAVILMGLPLYVICFFLSYRLQYSFSVLYACCFVDNMPGWGSILVLFDVLKASCIWMGKSFRTFRKFSLLILLNM
jgi:hypothetical protein